MAQSRSPADDMVEEEEEHEFFWTVQTSDLKTHPDSQSFALMAGHAFGIICKWKFYFIPGRVRYPVLGVKLVESNGPEEILAKVWIFLTGNGGCLNQSGTCDFKYRKITKGSSLECPFYRTGQEYPSAFGSIVSSSSSAWLHVKVKIRVKDFVAKQDEVRLKYSSIPKTLMLAMLENRDQKGDVTFSTKDGQAIVAHRNILSAQSDVFKAMFASCHRDDRERGGRRGIGGSERAGLKDFPEVYLYRRAG
ncbi:uncharacterized protein LOC118436450 [Folsomia candida]|uniref:uncharacterized protein LOC118436450 n=1 Tax=Folsomia candida TaxID=158441 RepID=UPI00160549A7|nr:uncharacterized protein LOC118436450 [Folsomia candida]